METQVADIQGVQHSVKLAKIAKAYDSEPWWYDLRGYLILRSTYRSSLIEQVRFFSNNIAAKQGSQHLEVAIGTGTLFALIQAWRKLLRKPATRITGVDYAEPMLDGARQRFKKDPQIELKHGDVTKLEFSDNSFDSANIANALHCFPDVDRALQEIFRVLKPGAKLAVNVILHPRGMWPMKQIAARVMAWGMRKGILYQPYDEKDVLDRVSRTGFELLQSKVKGNTLMFVARKPEPHLKLVRSTVNVA